MPDIHLVTPSASHNALSAALSLDPHLTSLPSPKADIVAPVALSHTTPTAEILRLPEVRAIIKSDFLLLPCDLVCELPGESLLESWMVSLSTLGGQQQSLNPGSKPSLRGAEYQKGGLGVYYETRGADHVKGAETDFIITTSLSTPTVPPADTSLRPYISRLLYETTADTLKDIAEDHQGFPLRHGLIRSFGRLRILTTHRDAHIYIFPHWVMDWVQQNEKLDSISEDVVGWWAKAGWQVGLAEKLQLGTKESQSNMPPINEGLDDNAVCSGVVTTHQGRIDLASMSTTHVSGLIKAHPEEGPKGAGAPPSMLAYVHPTQSSTTTNSTQSGMKQPISVPLIRRVDNPSLLLSTSLYIAALPSSSPPRPRLSHLRQRYHRPSHHNSRTQYTNR